MNPTNESAGNLVDEMHKAGAHFGYSKTRRHPSTRTYVFATKNRVDVLDLEKTEASLEKAKAFAFELGKTGKQILFVGTKPEAREAIKNAAVELEMPYVTERWVGGILTNYPEIKKRIARLVDLKEKKEKGELEKYTKMERLMIDREVERMDKNFEGLIPLKKAEAMFVIDIKKEHIAVSEAEKVHLPIITLSNSDCNIKGIEYPIVGNDAAISSIALFVREITKAYKDGRASV